MALDSCPPYVGCHASIGRCHPSCHCLCEDTIHGIGITVILSAHRYSHRLSLQMPYLGGDYMSEYRERQVQLTTSWSVAR